MPITTSLGALVDLEPVLVKVAGLKCTDMRVRYHVARLLQMVRVETQHFAEQQRRIIAELAVERDPTPVERAQFGPGRLQEIPEAAYEPYLAQVGQLRSVPVVLLIEPLTTTMLDACPDATSADLVGLGPACVFVDPADCDSKSHI